MMKPQGIEKKKIINNLGTSEIEWLVIGSLH